MIGVIADTHIPAKADKLSEEIFQHFKEVDLILHAGDLTTLSVIDELKKIAPVCAVYGNMDKGKIRKNLKRKEVIKVGKFKIGLIHTLGIVSKRVEKAKEEFSGSKINAVVFGHSHTSMNEEKKGILFFNPGCPTDDILCPYRSIGILKLSDKIEGKIIKLRE